MLVQSFGGLRRYVAIKKEAKIAAGQIIILYLQQKANLKELI